MASPTGGRFVFSPPTGFSAVTLGINLGGGAPIFPAAVSGHFNIEVFTATSVTGSASSLVLAPGFQAGVIDHGAGLPGGFLSGNTLELGSGNYFVVDHGASVTGAGPATIVGGTGNQTIYGAPGDEQIGGSGTQILNSLSQGGHESVFGGSGAGTTVYAGVGDVVVGGSGNEYIDGTAGKVAIHAGSAGTETVFGSFGNAISGAAAGADTLTGGAAAVVIQGLGKGDQVDFRNQTGNATINAQAFAFDSVSGHNVSVAASNVAISLGGGAATVFGAVGDTINLGSVAQYADGFAGGQTIHLGSAGLDSVFGSSVAGGADTVKAGGGANLTFNAATVGGGDLIDLAGSAGSAQIQAFFGDSATTSTNDTVIAGNGGTTVFGGSGDRIGADAAGNDLFLHSTSVTGATVGFGANAPLGNATVQVGAVDTIGGVDSIVGGFNQANDFVFYQNESTANTTAIIGTAHDVVIDTITSTQFTLTGGTTMTLIGVTTAQFTAAGGFIKP